MGCVVQEWTNPTMTVINFFALAKKKFLSNEVWIYFILRSYENGLFFSIVHFFSFVWCVFLFCFQWTVRFTCIRLMFYFYFSCMLFTLQYERFHKSSMWMAINGFNFHICAVYLFVYVCVCDWWKDSYLWFRFKREKKRRKTYSNQY